MVYNVCILCLFIQLNGNMLLRLTQVSTLTQPNGNKLLKLTIVTMRTQLNGNMVLRLTLEAMYGYVCQYGTKY